VTASGVTVKCTNCTHIFKVRSEDGSGKQKRPVTEDIEWVIRCGDGRSLRFRELTTLQKWIVERKVSKTDEISRSGRNWKKLAQITELSAFFQVVEAAEKARQLGQKETNPTPMTLPEPAAPKIGPSGKPTLDTFFDPDQILDDDPVEQWKKKRSFGKLIFWTLALFVVAGALLYVFRPDLVDLAIAKVKGTDPPGMQAMSMAQSALSKDDAGEIELLLEELMPRAQARRADAATVAAVSRLNAHRARHLSTLLRTYTPDVDKVKAARDEAQKLAYQLALRAHSAPGDRALAQLASADYQAARGALTEMQSDLEAAQKTPPSSITVQELAKEAEVISALGHTERALT